MSREKPSVVEPAKVRALLDTSLSSDGRRNVSCMAAALREARSLVGRNAATGHEETTEHRATWSGALVYLIFTEQIGSCFSAIGKEKPRRTQGIPDALRWFADIPDVDGQTLHKLRHRLAHDFTLSDPARGQHFNLSDEPHRPLVERDGEVAIVGLLTLAETVERLRNNLLVAADRGQARCHYVGGIEAVERRFQMSVYA